MRGRLIRAIGAGVAMAMLGTVSVVASPWSSAGAQSKGPLTVPVGMIVPAESFKPVVTAARASIEGFNKRNKNMKFEFVLCDSKADVNGETDCAREMVDEGVVATVGDIAVQNPTGINQILLAAGIPRMGLTMVGVQEFSSAISYPVSAGPILPAIGVAGPWADDGIKKISVVRADSPLGTALVNGLMKTPMGTVGVEIVNDVAVPVSSTDYSSYVAAAQANGAQALDAVMPPSGGLPLAKAAQQFGSDLPIFVPLFGYSEEDIVKTGYKTWTFVDSFPAPTPANAKAFPGLKLFLKDMAAANSKTLAPERLSGAMVQTWLSLQAITEVTEGATEVTASSLKSALDTATDIDMLDIVPPWTPSKPGPNAIFSRISNPFLFTTVLKGNKLITSNKNPVNLDDFFA